MATGIGETLRAARRQQGVPLADAAAETRVRESYLAALEEEDFGALGGDVYVKGFLRSYARFLRLDPEPLLASYRTHYERPVEEVSPLAQQSVSPMPGERRPVWVVAGGVAFLIIVLFAVIGSLGNDDNADRNVGAPNPVETSEPAGGAVSPLPSPSPSPLPTEGEPMNELDVAFQVSGATSWMRVTVDGAVEREGEQPDGTAQTYDAQSSIILRVGDASAVSITVNGDGLGELGEPGQVVEVTCEVGESECDIEPIT